MHESHSICFYITSLIQFNSIQFYSIRFDFSSFPSLLLPNNTWRDLTWRYRPATSEPVTIGGEGIQASGRNNTTNIRRGEAASVSLLAGYSEDIHAAVGGAAASGNDEAPEEEAIDYTKLGYKLLQTPPQKQRSWF